MELIDTHCHLGDFYQKDILDETVQKFKNNNVSKVISVGTNTEDSKLYFELSKLIPEVYYTSGIFPEYASSVNYSLFDFHKSMQSDKCVAIGEIGLDYHYEGYSEKDQKAVFLEQIDIANSLHKPIVIHSRDACYDTIQILKNNKSLLSYGFVMHCYSESAESAKELLKLGSYFSFTGVVTFKNSKRIDVLKSIPLDRIMVETDCPYMAPVPVRGTFNEPCNILYTYEFIANALNMDLEDFANIIRKNVKEFYKI